MPHRATKSAPGAGSLLGIHSQWLVNMDCNVYILHHTVEIKKKHARDLEFWVVGCQFVADGIC